VRPLRTKLTPGLAVLSPQLLALNGSHHISDEALIRLEFGPSFERILFCDPFRVRCPELSEQFSVVLMVAIARVSLSFFSFFMLTSWEGK
jgi:hypothetical protein